MAVITSRTSESGSIHIDHEKCTACGFCVTVCKDFDLNIENGKLVIAKYPAFGCITCGQCVAVCPHDAIKITGRTMKNEDFFDIPKDYEKPSYDALYKMLVSRRSIRDFKDKEVEPEIIDKILGFASTAPMGIPPSDVEVLVLSGKDKVKEFTDDFATYLKYMKFMFKPVVLALMRPFMKKEKFRMFKNFVAPLVENLIASNNKGIDHALYSTPCALYFYGTPYADAADQYIAATYATIAAESLGLGCCMIGCIGPFISKGENKLKAKYKIHPKNQDGLFIILGYPKYKYHKTIKRTFAKINKY
jgi:ferredoxin